MVVLGRCCSELCFVISEATCLIHARHGERAGVFFLRLGRLRETMSIFYFCQLNVRLSGSTSQVIRHLNGFSLQKIWKYTSQKCASPLTVVLLSLFGAGLSCFNNIGEDDLTSNKVLLQPHDALGLGELENDEYLDGETKQSRLRRRRTVTTVQGAHLQPLCGSRSFERLAEQPKSKQECGEITPILRYLHFGHLFQIPDRFCM